MTSDDSTDWHLAVAGEGEAFGRVFDRHHHRVLLHSRRLVANPHEADDVAAMTFFEAWRNRTRVRLVDGSVLPWLLVTCTNVASNTNRSARRYQALLSRLPVMDASADQHPESSDALDALRSLSIADRRVVVLCVLEGYSELEASAALGVPPGTIKSRLSRAKARLRNRLDAPHPRTTLTEEVGQ